VDEPGECRRVARGIELPDVLGRPRAHDLHQPLDRLQDARDPAERERRRAEADDFPVVVARVAPDNLDRIGG